jgi:hypothetical protein
MRVHKNQSVSFSDPLSLTLSPPGGERELLQHPPPGEGQGIKFGRDSRIKRVKYRSFP